MQGPNTNPYGWAPPPMQLPPPQLPFGQPYPSSNWVPQPLPQNPQPFFGQQHPTLSWAQQPLQPQPSHSWIPQPPQPQSFFGQQPYSPPSSPYLQSPAVPPTQAPHSVRPISFSEKADILAKLDKVGTIILKSSAFIESQEYNGNKKQGYTKLVDAVQAALQKIPSTADGNIEDLRKNLQAQINVIKAIASQPTHKPIIDPFIERFSNVSISGRTPQPAQEEIPDQDMGWITDLSTVSDRDRKEYRIEIMRQTTADLQFGSYKYKDQTGRTHIASLSLQDATVQQVFDSGSRPHQRPGRYNTKLFLDKRDCLTVARECAKRGLTPLVLAAANSDQPGGGYLTGAGAQEENLYRRSGLSFIVDHRKGLQQKNFYPLHKQGDTAGLYVSNVPVFRGQEDQGYPYLNEPFKIGVAVMAACNFNVEHQRQKHVRKVKNLIPDPHSGKRRIPHEEAQLTKEKLRTTLHMAEQNGHKSVVLIPLGCGAFHNPPEQIAEMCMELITKEFPRSFEEIHISIIDDHNTGKEHNPRGNFIEFKETMNRFGVEYKITK